MRASKAGTETYTKAKFDGNELLDMLKALDMAAEMSACGTPRSVVGTDSAEEERDSVQFALCFHSTLAVMPSAHTHPTPLMPL